METFPFGEHFQAISRQKSSFVWRLWKWKDKNPCNACARYAREGLCKTISLRSIFQTFPLVRKNLPRSKKISESFPKNSHVFPKISDIFWEKSDVLRCNSVPFCHLMVLAVDRTTILNLIWLFLWHSHHEELCKIADLRYKNTNTPLFSTII